MNNQCRAQCPNGKLAPQFRDLNFSQLKRRKLPGLTDQKQEIRVPFLHVPKQQHLLMLVIGTAHTCLDAWFHHPHMGRGWFKNTAQLLHISHLFPAVLFRCQEKITYNPNFFQRRNPEYVPNLPSFVLVVSTHHSQQLPLG